MLKGIRGTLMQVRHLPESGAPCRGVRFPARRLIVPGWPFWVIFVVHADEVLVLAFAHMKRRPGYWTRRPNSP